ncbi:MAG: hypothetical protein JWO53_919, partial [Chlamydiia bacterium]|nr:hypothetical protein [Chlamydiia bacterium]
SKKSTAFFLKLDAMTNHDGFTQKNIKHIKSDFFKALKNTKAQKSSQKVQKYSPAKPLASIPAASSSSSSSSSGVSSGIFTACDYDYSGFSTEDQKTLTTIENGCVYPKLVLQIAQTTSRNAYDVTKRVNAVCQTLKKEQITLTVNDITFPSK